MSRRVAVVIVIMPPLQPVPRDAGSILDARQGICWDFHLAVCLRSEILFVEEHVISRCTATYRDERIVSMSPTA